jgi:hypothetical protein
MFIYESSTRRFQKPREIHFYRRSTLNSKLLFAEKMVAIASANLKGDIQFQMNSKPFRDCGQYVWIQIRKRPKSKQPNDSNNQLESVRSWNSSKGNQYHKKSVRS